MKKEGKFMMFLKNNKYVLWIKGIIPIISFLATSIIFYILYSYGYSIDDQAYFYTLSTIPQALAALIGIISAFIIYRLQVVRSEKAENIKQLGEFVFKEKLIDKFPRLDVPLSDGQLLKICNTVKEEFKGEGSTQWEIRRIALKLIHNILESKMYKLHFSFPLRAGAFVIIISFFLLSLGRITLPEKSLFPIFNPTFFVGQVIALSLFVVLSITESLILIFEIDD